MNDWLGLSIGNSRINWGLFQGEVAIEFGSCQHLSNRSDRDTLIKQIFSSQTGEVLPIYLASVVPQQTKLWLDYSLLRQITLQDIPVKNLYSTLGIDRALAVYGAGEIYGYPALVIDGGTALTFTGIDAAQKLVGGAILPGLRAQLTFLPQKTAALPKIELPQSLPNRWSLDTKTAIASGVIHTLIAGITSFIDDWLESFPYSQIVFTGGDSNLLWQYLLKFDKSHKNLIIDRHLVVQSLKFIYQSDSKNNLL
ncbi:pantothenate kinase [Myxosarcina sp. GI1]|uniref:pantothenate kinase n=1 Tax=Myxosarcina sp. GI1 TaxID=1541065 RepID=UPI00055A3988|nr:pantothenate kinase [Myxosarcina sp. GI1]